MHRINCWIRCRRLLALSNGLMRCRMSVLLKNLLKVLSSHVTKPSYFFFQLTVVSRLGNIIGFRDWIHLRHSTMTMIRVTMYTLNAIEDFPKESNP